MCNGESGCAIGVCVMGREGGSECDGEGGSECDGEGGCVM